MEHLYDHRKIEDLNQINESYIGYGKTDLSEMTKKELENELNRAEKDIENTKDEINTAKSSYPSYTVKERLQNAEWYKQKVLNALADLKEESCEENKLEIHSIDDMILDLDRKLERGFITEEYHDLYVEKLNSKRELYEENKSRQLQLMKESTDPKPKRRFKIFKSNLRDYKK